MALFNGTTSRSTARKKPTKRQVSKSYMPKHAPLGSTGVDIPSAEGSAFIAEWASKMEQQTFVME